VAPRKRRGIIKTEGGSTIRLIKPLIGHQQEMEKRLEKFPFEKNVFLMMKFRKENTHLSKYIISRLAAEGLNGVREDQTAWNITNDVYNPIAVLYCCKYGIALFDKAEEHQAYNPNVIYELGIMHSLERECMILLDKSLPRIPFDLAKNLYAPYSNKKETRRNIHLWVERILPSHPLTPIPARATSETKLQRAAVSARREDKDSVIEAPESISATELSWQVASKDDKTWRLTWSIHLTNKVRRTAKVKVQVLFLDGQGFALDDHTTKPVMLPPGGTYVSEATTALSSDLAVRVHRAVAVVIRQKK